MQNIHIKTKKSVQSFNLDLALNMWHKLHSRQTFHQVLFQSVNYKMYQKHQDHMECFSSYNIVCNKSE